MPGSMCTIEVPTRLLWGMDDFALLPGLLDGLEAWIADLDIRRIPDASHWLVHEQPGCVHAELADFLQSK
jgi:pimeloyl-ACP methyl ester carboxylesterase